MKILLGYRACESEANDLFASMMPTGLGLIAGTLSEAGHEVLLVNFTRMGWGAIRRLLLEEQPRMLGLTLYTFNRHTTLKLAALARELLPGATVVVGGPHASHCSASVLENCPQVDFAVRGEGEETAVELAAALEAGTPAEAVAGLVFRGRDGLLTTPARPPVADLDRLPFAHRHYRSIGVDRLAQFSYLITSRGCPAQCSFCGTPDFWGQKLRFRSAASIVRELRELRDHHGILFFSIRDDTFSFNRKRVTDFCQELLDSRLGILWDCQSRVNAVDLERLQWMRRAGCEQVQYGVEHGSPPLLELLNKGTTLEQVRRASAATRRAGLILSMYLITGIPGEEESHFQQLLDLVAETRPHDIVPTRLGYLPGTELWFQACRERGWTDDTWWRHRNSGVYAREDRRSKEFLQRLLDLASTLASRNRYTRADFENQRLEMGEHQVRDLAAAATYEADDDPRAAEGELRALHRREPESLWGSIRLGEFLARTGRAREAVPLFERALETLPVIAPVHSLLGLAWLELGQRAKARRAFEQALRLDPCEPTALAARG